jgi:hypothetical protein
LSFNGSIENDNFEEVSGDEDTTVKERLVKNVVKHSKPS